MKKTNVIRLLSFCLSLTLVVLGMFLKERKRANEYQSLFYKKQEMAFVNIETEFENLTLDLEKMIYLSSYAQLNKMSDEIINKCKKIRIELTQLGFEQEQTLLNEFLTEIENYPQYLNEIDFNNTTNLQENFKKLSTLMEQAKKISKLLSEIKTESKQNIPNELSSVFGNGYIKNHSNELNIQQENDESSLKGPYSNHIVENSQWEFLLSKEEIEMSQALNIAEEISQSKAMLSFNNLIEDIISVYVFSNENVEVGISVNGGKVVYMKKKRASRENNISQSRAVEFADVYITKCGFLNMVETYHYEEDGVIKVNYAYLDGETVCYSDLITVGVATDNGEILSIETYGYLANHKERTVPSPVFSVEQAKETLNNKLNVTSYVNALIPTLDGEEKRCYAFYCEGVDLRKILVYVNAEDLKEEHIILLQ